MNQNMTNDKEQRIERLVNRFMTSCAKGVHALRYALVMVMMVAGVNAAWAQPVEITTDTNGNGIIDDNEKKFYLIQTNAFKSFYMAPKNNSVMTNNILGDYMLWYFLDADTDGEIQYYYIVNNSTEKCIYNSSDRSITLTNLANLSNENKEKCKFKLVLDNSDNTTDFYNIDLKGRSGNEYYGLNKQNGSANDNNPIRLTNDQYIHDSNSKWKFVPFNGTYIWPNPPFTPSTDSDKHFYKIWNVKNNAYYVSTDETPDKVTFASTESDRMVWYLKEAGSDTWFKYYYIISPSVDGKYMYYSGNATNGNDQTDAVSIKTYDSTNEDRYQFVVVQAARGDGASRVECYAIIPKPLLIILWGSNSLGPKAISDGANMGIIKNRGDVSGQWKFVPTDFSTVCAAPTITFSNATGDVTITTTTSNSSIYYTTDDTPPSSSNGTSYSAPFNVTEQTTIKAIVTRTGFTDSEVTTKTIYKVATPSIQDNGSNAISITCATEGATIYYTTNGSTPTTSSTPYTGPLTENVSGVTIKAIAVKDGMINSGVGTGSVMLQCAKPIITRVGDYATISCSFPSAGVSIYYTLNGGTPSSSSTPYSGNIPVTNGDVIRAIAIATNYLDSEVAERIIRSPLTPTDGIYYINSDEDFETFVDMANADGASFHYVLQANVNASTAITQDFSGIFDGGNCVITGLTDPLFNTVDGGTVKNVTLKDVDISSSAPNVGAIAGVAKGYSRIYNCGILPNSADFPNGTGSHPSVTTTGACAGGIVGSLEDDSRVINCYSYADVSAATYAAGIVGNNTFASNTTVTDSKYGNLRTAVVNCMFYGDILGGTNQYGVYGGELITNATTTGISSYNYFRNGSKFTAANGHPNSSGGANVVGNPTAYNCSFPAEERYLTQVEFHRSLLNSNRELCGWRVGSDVIPRTMSTIDVQAIPKNASIMYKWVVDPSLAPPIRY